MQDFKNLKVWQKAHALALEVYAETARFPQHELFGLTSQLRRAAVSVIANIAEGSSRRGNREFGHFLSMAAGSLSEIECLLLLSGDLSYLSKQTLARLIGSTAEVRKMLVGLGSRLNRVSAPVN